MKMVLIAFLCSLPAFTAQANGAPVQLPSQPIEGIKRPRPAVVIDGAQWHRACWYDNKQYSEGAPLEIAGRLLICGAKNERESNGPLIWLSAEQLTEREKPRVRVH
ncbi:DUF1496 domain-containing protein [Ferrimonas pelagia]|uniref:DUF1496 domain-containing protein n=1 Tax=Ferrimonas pelagia TaxID=1177826 RepID=A0ABP9EIN3_9GAMM